MNQPTPAQMNALLQYASKKLGVPPEQLARTVADGGAEALTASLSEDNKKVLASLAGDPKKAEALLNSPAVRRYLAQFTK